MKTLGWIIFFLGFVFPGLFIIGLIFVLIGCASSTPTVVHVYHHQPEATDERNVIEKTLDLFIK